MRRLLLSLLLLLAPALAQAATRYNSGTGLCAGGTGSGCWNDATATWSATSCTNTTYVAAPTSSDDVILCPGKTVTVPCNTAAALKTLADDASWTASDTGGLIANGSACSAGQVPTFTFHSTASTTSAKFARMGAPATFTLVGRSVTTDGAWGEPSDLTDSCGGSDKTVNGVTWASARNECSKYTWAKKPFVSSIPTGMSTLTLGNLVWFTSGMYRNNWATVIAATANTLTIGYGDPNDAFGTQSTMPAITNSSSTSIEVPMDVRLSAWDVSNPTRIVATIQGGALSALPSAGNGDGQRAGWCLITRTDTTPAGSGKFYRIAASVDGGANDSLILDPWETVAPADSLTAFTDLAASAENAWIAPCVKPADRWYSFEPVVWKPATAGTNQSSMAFFAGMCPTLTRVYNPNATAANDGAGAWSDLTNPAFVFYGQSGCTIAGPWAIGPMREVASLQGYVVGIKETNGFTISNTSMQGSYWYSSPSDTVWHGFSYLDSAGLVFDRVNVSFINNEAFYLHQQTEETSNSDSPFEGMDLTIKHSTIHDIFHKVGLSDSGSGIDINHSTQTSGTYTFNIFDNLIYNVVNAGIVSISGPQAGTVNIYSNVIGPIHRLGELDSGTRQGVWAGNITGGVDQSQAIVNNAFLTTVDYNRTTAGYTVAVQGSNTAYNYFGEWFTAKNMKAALTTFSASYGDLIEGAGAISNTSVLTSSTSQFGIAFDRTDTVTGLQIVRDLTVRRFCSLLGARIAAINQLGEVTPATTLEPHFTHSTFGLFCPEAAASTTNASTAGIYAQGANGVRNLAAGSEISNNLFVTGDNSISTTFSPFPISLSYALSGNSSFTLGKNMCTRCEPSNATCGYYYTGGDCITQGESGYTFLNTNVNLAKLTVPLRMESMGIVSATDNRLLPWSLAYAFDANSDHVGARYSGIVTYSQAMKDAGIPMDWIYQRADPQDVPDRTILPDSLKFLIPTGHGGASGWLPKAF